MPSSRSSNWVPPADPRGLRIPARGLSGRPDDRTTEPSKPQAVARASVSADAKPDPIKLYSSNKPEISQSEIVTRLEKLEHARRSPRGVSGGAAVEATLAAVAGWPLVGKLFFDDSPVFLSGFGYVAWYKRHVSQKIELAFAPGYDPALELANLSFSSRESNRIRRKEQDLIDVIVEGEVVGHYYLILGPKGTGKSSMIMNTMRRISADGVAICEAHPDLEVFRVRLGKAINYDYNEDAQFGLFQRRDPKEGGPALDIERALNKLEKAAIRSARSRKKPLVLVLSNTHLFQNDDEGRRMLQLLQQKAENWAESRIVTVVFCSDDFWPYTTLRKAANRIQVVSIQDLSQRDSLQTLRLMRQDAGVPEEPGIRLQEALRYVGGRLSVLGRLGRSTDVVAAAQEVLALEKAWLLSLIGLIPDCDDDVMNEQKWASCSWLLLREFVRIQKAAEVPEAGKTYLDKGPAELPSLPYWKCRQIMTRGDFLGALDHANIISIDIQHDVRPDSLLILQAAREVCEEPDFEEILKNVRARVDEIESLNRTRELVLKSRKGSSSWVPFLFGAGRSRQ